MTSDNIIHWIAASITINMYVSIYVSKFNRLKIFENQQTIFKDFHGPDGTLTTAASILLTRSVPVTLLCDSDSVIVLLIVVLEESGYIQRHNYSYLSVLLFWFRVTMWANMADKFQGLTKQNVIWTKCVKLPSNCASLPYQQWFPNEKQPNFNNIGF